MGPSRPEEGGRDRRRSGEGAHLMAISRAKAATKALSNHSSSLNVSALGSVSQPGPLSVMHGDCAASTMAEAKMSTIIAPSKYGETTTYAARPGTGPKVSARSPAGVCGGGGPGGGGVDRGAPAHRARGVFWRWGGRGRTRRRRAAARSPPPPRPAWRGVAGRGGADAPAGEGRHVGNRRRRRRRRRRRGPTGASGRSPLRAAGREARPRPAARSPPFPPSNSVEARGAARRAADVGRSRASGCASLSSSPLSPSASSPSCPSSGGLTPDTCRGDRGGAGGGDA